MEQYKQEFIEFMVESQVLKFGEFTLKSGRKSPFFMNAGAYVTGSQLKRLGEYYAKAIHDNYGLDFDVLFGPAYKGIPLSVVPPLRFMISTVGKYVTAPTGKKQKTTAEMQDCCLEAKLKTATALSSSRMLPPPENPSRRRSRSSRHRAMWRSKD